LSDDDATREGQVLEDRYRLHELVGKGGMGEVYRAEHIHIDKRVAVKLLRGEASRDEKNVKRLQREARATSTIGHDNIVAIEDFGKAEDGTVYLVMEWLEGETLGQVLDRETIEAERALRIIEQVCDALHAAHEAGVIHRDLKPDNIFLATDDDGDEIVKLVDFGIAKFMRDDGRITKTGTFVGTPDYVAPEQALGEEVDRRADIYAIGVILYELYTGTLPFSARTFMSILEQHITAQPEAPNERNPERHTPEPIVDIIMRCMAKEPHQRYDTAVEVGGLLRQIRESGSVNDPVGRTKPVPRTSKPMTVDVRTPTSQPTYGSIDVDRPATRRTMPILLLLGLVAAIGVGAFFIVRGAKSEASGADAATSTPPPTRTEWQYSSTAKQFSYSVTMSPSPAVPGKPIALRIALGATDAALGDAIRAGTATAVVEVFGAGNRRELRAEVAIAGSLDLVEPIRLAPSEPGTYRVEVELSAGKRALGETSFDICIGGDPLGDPAALERVCPKMNSNRE
jgi:serine/threonine protein kinase